MVTKARIYLLSGKSALAADALDEIKEEDLNALTPLKREACIQEREYLEAEIFKKYGMDEQAEKHYKNAFKGNKHSRTYYEAGYALAKMKFEKKELDKSITICNRLMKTADEKYMIAKSSLLCGTIYMSCNDHANAMAAFSKAGREDVECYGLAQLEIARGNYDAAFKLLTSHRYGSQNLFFRVLYSKLIIYYRQNRYAEFLQLYNIFNTLPNSMAEYKTNVNLMKLILTSRRNELVDCKTEIYENMQVVDYSLDRAFMHTTDKYLKPSEGKRFNSLSTIENLFVETKRQIDAGKLRPNYNGVFDRYTVEKEDIAFDGVNILSSASAIVIPETSDIIYMYPNDKSGFALDKIPDVCDLKDDPKIRKRS